jgi:predicted GNAT family N-acyltransferase
MSLICQEVEHLSPAYWETVGLRHDVLREPLGLRFSDEELRAEGGSWHLAAYSNGALVACMVLKPLGLSVKMRQVATAQAQQRKGYGQQLVAFAEGLSRQRGGTRMELHARLTAVPFYERLGYHCVGEQFFEVGIPHFRMEKEL